MSYRSLMALVYSFVLKHVVAYLNWLLWATTLLWAIQQTLALQKTRWLLHILMGSNPSLYLNIVCTMKPFELPFSFFSLWHLRTGIGMSARLLLRVSVIEDYDSRLVCTFAVMKYFNSVDNILAYNLTKLEHAS